MDFASLDKKALTFYTGKWFCIWSTKLLVLGLMAVLVLFTFLWSACASAGNHND